MLGSPPAVAQFGHRVLSRAQHAFKAVKKSVAF